MSFAEDGLVSGSPSETGNSPDSGPKGSSVGCSSAAQSSVRCSVYRALENGVQSSNMNPVPVPPSATAGAVA
eukprot:3722605-Rhodomonas_salina.1